MLNKRKQFFEIIKKCKKQGIRVNLIKLKRLEKLNFAKNRIKEN